MRYVVLLCLLINTAFADVLPPLESAIVERKTSGGFVPEEMRGYVEKVSIYSNGQIFVSFKKNDNAVWHHRLVALLPQEIMNTLNHVVTNAQAGQLEFPDTPECTDTPISTYALTKADGETIIFAKVVACKTGHLTSFYNGFYLQTILDGFGAIDYLDAE